MQMLVNREPLFCFSHRIGQQIVDVDVDEDQLDQRPEAGEFHQANVRNRRLRCNYIIILTIRLQLLASAGVVAGSAGALLYALDQSVEASGSEVHPTKMPWSHDGIIASFDHSRYVNEKT